MRKNGRKILFAIITCVCVISLVSCKGGIDRSEAKTFINDFFAEIVSQNYDKAEEFLHPERPADLEEFFNTVEKSVQIDFQEGIVIEKYNGFSSSLYDSTVDGPTLELTMSGRVGETEVDFTIEIVQNENGYGIYNFEIDT